MPQESFDKRRDRLWLSYNHCNFWDEARLKGARMGAEGHWGGCHNNPREQCRSGGTLANPSRLLWLLTHPQSLHSSFPALVPLAETPCAPSYFRSLHTLLPLSGTPYFPSVSKTTYSWDLSTNFPSSPKAFPANLDWNRLSCGSFSPKKHCDR